MKTNEDRNIEGMYISTEPRQFTFDQLLEICKENDRVMDQNVDLSDYRNNVSFFLLPALVHNYSFKVPVTPYLRVMVFPEDSDEWIGIQDMTFEQWEMGEEL